MWYGHYVGGWPMALGMVLFWGSLIALIAWVIHRLTGRRDSDYPPPHRRDAMEILKERYARGEISKQEFDEVKRDLIG